MSEILLTEAVAPATPAAGKSTMYVKTDGRWYWKSDAGVETPFKTVGAGSGDLLSDGTVPLTSNWDVGAFKITALQFESDIVTGTSPLIVASTTVVTNLNADLLDGQEGSWYASVTYVDNAVVGLFEDKGNYDAATNTPDLDVAPSGVLQGDVYVVSVAGVFFTANVEVGDTVRALQDSPTLLTHWAITQTNLDAASVKTLYESNADTNEYSDAEQTTVSNQSGTNTGDEVAATEGVAGVVERATQAETDAGTDTTRYMSAANYEASEQRTKYIGQNLQVGTAYELVLSDAGKMIEMNNAAANVLTIPANSSVAFPVDTRIDITQGGAGLTSVTITTDTLNGEKVSYGQYKALSLWKKSATVWVIYGGTT